MDRQRFFRKLISSQAESNERLIQARKISYDNMRHDRQIQEELGQIERNRIKNALIAGRRSQDEANKSRRIKLLDGLNEFYRVECGNLHDLRVQFLKAMTENTRFISDKAQTARKNYADSLTDEAERTRMLKIQEENANFEAQYAHEVLLMMYADIQQHETSEKKKIFKEMKKVKLEQLKHLNQEMKNAVGVIERLMKLQNEHIVQEKRHADEMVTSMRLVQFEHENTEAVHLRRLLTWLMTVSELDVERSVLRVFEILANEKQQHVRFEQEQTNGFLKFIQQEQDHHLKMECTVLGESSALLIKELKHMVEEDVMAQQFVLEVRKDGVEHTEEELQHCQQLNGMIQNAIDNHMSEETKRNVNIE